MMGKIPYKKEYREKVKRHYNIDFSNAYDVHHIDLNRENNDISNLMILPKSLHHRYHFYLNAVKRKEASNPFEISFDAKISAECFSRKTYEITMICGFLDVYRECAKWYDFKMYLDGLCPNVHGITLEG